MAKLDQVYVYLFDIFEKSVASSLISSLDKILGKNEERRGSISAGKKQWTEIKHIWKIDNIGIFFSKVVEERDKVILIEKTTATTQQELLDLIRSVSIIGVDNDTLPYYILVILVDLKEDRIAIDQSFRVVENFTNYFGFYLDSLKGLASQLFVERPIAPSLRHFQVNQTAKEFGNLKQSCQKLYEIKEKLTESESEVDFNKTLKRFQKISSTINQNPPFNLKHPSPLLLSTSITDPHSFSFIGYSRHIRNEPFFSMFSVNYNMRNLRYSVEPRDVDVGSTETKLWIRYNNSPTLLFLATMNIWLLHLFEKGNYLDSELNGVRKDIKSILVENRPKELRASLSKLYSKITDLADLISDVSRLKRETKLPIKDLLENGKEFVKEIPIMPSQNVEKWMELKKGTNGSYIHYLTKKLVETIDELLNKLELFHSDNEKLYSHSSNIINLHYQETEKSHNKIMTVFTIGIIFLTSVLLVITLLD